MRTALRRGLFFSLLLGLAFPLVSCDSGGSNSSPDWTGTWEVRDFGDGGGAPSSPNYWDLSTDELRIVEVFDNEECRLAAFEVTSRDGDVVEFLGTTPNSENETVEFRFEVSGETLMATILDASDEEENVGNEITLTEVGGIPVNTENCTTDNPT